MKALIPAAGLGTRFLPLSKAVPKELIPVRGLPVLHHVVAEAKAAGCREIGIILSAGKEAIRRYFSWDAALMDWLDRTGKRAVMAEWEALLDGLHFSWIDQPEQRGLGDAIACGAAFAAGDPVAVLLGDTIMQGGSPLPEMVRRHHAEACSMVAVEPVPAQRATRYGVCGGHIDEEGAMQLDSMIEKPSLEEMPVMRDPHGNALPDAWAFAARYLLSPGIFEALKHTGKGRNGEIQLTDAMRALMQAEGFGAVRLPGSRLDVGTPEALG
jgi:UTP--glucose-1-phosphate uridylyltransferase